MYDANLGGERVAVYAFTDPDGAAHEYPADQAAWLAIGETTEINEAGQALGAVTLKNAQGEIEYIWLEQAGAEDEARFVEGGARFGWVKTEPVTAASGANVLSAAGWQFIEINRRLVALDPGLYEVNGSGQDVVVSTGGVRYVWNENGWEKEGPPVKEFTFCPDIKKYRECFIPAEDLLSGAYQDWLERNYPQEYNLDTIEQVPFFFFELEFRQTISP